MEGKLKILILRIDDFCFSSRELQEARFRKYAAHLSCNLSAQAADSSWTAVSQFHDLFSAISHQSVHLSPRSILGITVSHPQ